MKSAPLLFACDAARRMRQGFQSLLRDGRAAGFADAVFAGIQSGQHPFDLRHLGADRIVESFRHVPCGGDEVMSLAQENQSELHLLHVLPVTIAPAVTALPANVEDNFQRAARLLHQSVPSEAHLWCSVKQAVRSGQPYREILDYAEENEIDLVCLGVHGAGFAMRALFGSNADRVLRQSPCPILITRPLKPALESVL